MPPRKRKPNPKYSDDPPEPPVKRARTKAETPVKRASAPRTAKEKREDPDWLVSNEKSPLAYEDLHAELCDPKTYEGYTKEDWDDLRATLPEEVPVNPDGYSIPIEYLRYDPDFRRGIREFQEDLAEGRLDPKWQAAAAKAMEERARGDFDAYKENQYEEFWGQKQKLSYELLAGEATKVKLELMIENGVFRVGDEIVYTRVFGRKENRVLVEKECKIASIGKKTMTIAIPPGRLKYLPHVASAEMSDRMKKDEGKHESDAGGEENRIKDVQETKELSLRQAEDNQPPEVDKIEGDPIHGNVEDGSKAPTAADSFNHDKPATSIEVTGIIDRASTPDHPTHGNQDAGSELSTPSPKSAPTDVVFHEIQILKHLSDKIIEVDGRLDPNDLKQVPATQIWRLMRVKRNNQDLGTMFEMRSEFHAYKLPHVDQKPQKGDHATRTRKR